MPKIISDEGAMWVDRPLEAAIPRTLRTKTMTTGILHFGARFQLWVNQLVARHLEAEAAKFAR
jgi:hypothetical protein